jgi:hypothetical protein
MNLLHKLLGQNDKRLGTTLMLSVVGTLALSACDRTSSTAVAPPAIAPEATFVKMVQRTHALRDADAKGWIDDILTSLDDVKMPRTNESMCAVMAVIEQESGYKEDPPVAGLSTLLANKIKKMGSNLALRLALEVRLDQAMSTGKTFREGIKQIKTERDLSNWYTEFTESRYTSPILKYMGKSVDDVVSTVGSMQVSIDYARKVAASLGQSSMNMRETLYTRKGGVLFGTAHLFYYPTHYTDMLYRFADFNAGHYASRNAGFQTMVSQLTGKPLNADGDLIEHQADNPNSVSETQNAVMQLLAKKMPNITAQTIQQDLALEKSLDFESTVTYQTVAQLYAQKYKKVLSQQLPKISLKSEKITRNLTTEWYANSVNRRYQQCLSVAQRANY